MDSNKQRDDILESATELKHILKDNGTLRPDSSTDVDTGSVKKAGDQTEAGGHDVFGDETDAEVQYKTMGWVETAFVLIAETVSLGILSLPSTLNAVGLIPGVILLISLGIIATYTGYVLGQFKLKYPQIHTFADAGMICFGAPGYYICAIGQVLFLVFIMAAHILSFSIMCNVISDHSMCTIIFSAIGLALSAFGTIPRTMKGTVLMSYLSSASVLGAVFICMFGVGLAPGANSVTFKWFNRGTQFYTAFGAVTNIIFAYAGHVAFFMVFSEMKEPKHFWKSLYALQILEIILYTVTAIVIYRFTGSGVKSPALGSTTPLLSKIAYGIASPTIVVAGIINGHVAVKFLFMIFAKKRPHLVSSNGFAANALWIGILVALWIVAWVIASAIPVFNHLLGLISALFLSWFTYGISGYFWMYMNWGRLWATKWNMMLTVLNASIMCMGSVIMVLGLYSSVKAMINEKGSGCFSCADNS